MSCVRVNALHVGALREFRALVYGIPSQIQLKKALFRLNIWVGGGGGCRIGFVEATQQDPKDRWWALRHPLSSCRGGQAQCPPEVMLLFVFRYATASGQHHSGAISVQT